MSEQTGSVPGTRTPAAPPGGLPVPFLGGVAGAAAMLALYLGLITLAESFRHALQQLRADAVWVALVAGGLGLQIGLYLRVRQIVKGRSAGGQALTGAGTGTSTAGMVACCAHHLTDLAPIIGLTGATTFLTQYRLVFISGGLMMNLIGILMSLRTLRSVAAHQRATAAAPSCH